MKHFNIKKYLPVIIGVLLSIPLAIGAFFLTQGAMTRANVSAPQNVKSTTTSTTAVITWTTDNESQGVVEYGTTPNNINTYAPEIVPKMQHRVEITLLEPNTPYYFKIRIGDELYDNEGLAWTFRTKNEGEDTTPRDTAEDSTPLPTLAVVDEQVMRLPTASASIMLQQQVINQPTEVPMNCPETRDCERIKALLGTECTTAEYVTCMKKNSNVQGASTQKKSSKPRTTSTPKPTLAKPSTNSGE